MDSAAFQALVGQYRQLLAARQERFSSDSVFGSAKNQFEKALLEQLGQVRDPERAQELQSMFVELATFVPQQDADLAAECGRRSDRDPAVKGVLDLIDTGDHDAIQKELDARSMPELVRYYALFRRVALEREARRRQAESVQSLGAES